MSEQRLHGLQRRPAIEDAEQAVVLIHLVSEQKLFIPGAAFTEIDGRKYPLVGHFTVQYDLGVARTLELLEDHLVHAASGIDERRGDDRQRTTTFDITRRTENFARDL